MLIGAISVKALEFWQLLPPTSREKLQPGLQDLIAQVTDAFVPPDLRERLRDQLYALKQKSCPTLKIYI
ncbi:uncharacterized protein CCR75_007342 [Bremia lactucae]|uniref:Uncharacterized protein n=1 Tax=Bremia lactucae TaxID=4779 RepID=A0A976IAP4_BRELC|nr:hypothetical protein CCR75_007342 [Bremia lactucae]